jgi:hypothetical protein
VKLPLREVGDRGTEILFHMLSGERRSENVVVFKHSRCTRDIMNAIIAVNAGGVLGIRVNNGVETALFRSGLFMVFHFYLIFYFLFFCISPYFMTPLIWHELNGSRKFYFLKYPFNLCHVKSV